MIDMPLCRRTHLAVALSLLLGACGATANTISPDAETQTIGEAGRVLGAAPAQPASARSVERGSFTTYRDGVVGRGEKIALYFCASWQPFCIRNERMVQGWYDSDEPFPINAYRVEYDSPLTDTMKVRFGVTDPDTWVIVDGSGRYYRRVQGANPTQLRSFLLTDPTTS